MGFSCDFAKIFCGSNAGLDGNPAAG